MAEVTPPTYPNSVSVTTDEWTLPLASETSALFVARGCANGAHGGKDGCVFAGGNWCLASLL